MSTKDIAELVTVIIGGALVGIGCGYFGLPWIEVIFICAIFYGAVTLAFRTWKE